VVSTTQGLLSSMKLVVMGWLVPQLLGLQDISSPGAP